MSAPDAVIQFPDGWVTDEVKPPMVLVCGADRMLVTIDLEDGGQVIAMTFPGGRRYARSTRDALEEHFAGGPAPDDVIAAWAVLIDLVVARRQSDHGPTT